MSIKQIQVINVSQLWKIRHQNWQQSIKIGYARSEVTEFMCNFVRYYVFMSSLIIKSRIFAVAVMLVAALSAYPFVLVLDPGHGGKDYGCIGKLTNEKTIVLDVAKRLADIVAKEHPEVKMVYTRKNDRFIPLSERAAIANRNKADLFISIHVNSIDRRTKGREKIHGASVYTLGLHRSDDNLAVAMRENSVIELEEDYSETYQGFDPSSSESYIIFELTQNLHLQQSIEFADAVQRELVSSAGRADKGVRQSGFLVLRATSMPAILVELDFICNPQAERFLASAEGRQKCARSLADAFSGYYKRHDPAKNSYKQTPAPADKVNVDNKETVVSYSVQFLTHTQLFNEDAPELKGLEKLSIYQQNGSYSYTTGNFKTLKDAKKCLKKVKKKFPGAFIIKLRGNVRVDND